MIVVSHSHQDDWVPYQWQKNILWAFRKRWKTPRVESIIVGGGGARILFSRHVKKTRKQLSRHIKEERKPLLRHIKSAVKTVLTTQIVLKPYRQFENRPEKSKPSGPFYISSDSVGTVWTVL